MFAFDESPLWLNLAIFGLGAAVVWFAGTRLTRYAEGISDRTRIGHALIGALLLGGVTSLPELATTSTAALEGNSALAVNNIFGGVAMQIAILALADAVIGREALSTEAGDSSLLLQGNGLMLCLGLAVAGISSGPFLLLGVDLWTTALIVVVIVVFAAIQRYEQHPYWRPTEDDGDVPTADSDEARGVQDQPSERSIQRLVVCTVAAGLVVILAGYLITLAGDAISTQTGLGASFVGAIFLAVATSLPEISTTLEAVRRRHHRLAFSNVFGTNLFDVGLLFFADLLLRDAAVLEEVGDFSVFAAMLGIILTAIYVAGILQRRKRVVLRMAVDSALVLVVYLLGTVILYTLR